MRLTAIAALALTALAGCATTETGPVEPQCRAPNTQEFEIFRAIVSRDRQTLIRNTAQGRARTALLTEDPYANGHMWGSQGYTGGTMLGVLSQPPLCVLDLPAIAPESQRTIAVYSRERYEALRPAVPIVPETGFRPYGTHRQDYLRCTFVNTAEGWRMTDLCALVTAQTPTG